MLQLLSSWTRSMRGEIERRAVQRRLLDLVARLPYEPESRSTYQHLVEEHIRLAHPARIPERH
jgi:hypothetical protein